MTKHLMPMRFGPVLAGGSWYSLFFVNTLPLAATPYPALLLYYGAFLALFFIVFIMMRNYFTHSDIRPAR